MKVYVVIDSTVLNAFGEGEWKVSQQRYRGRRTWCKLHFAVDESMHEILAAALTTNDMGDNEEMQPNLLNSNHGPIEQVSADETYDSWENHRHIHQREEPAAIPPRRTVRVCQHGRCPRNF